MPGMGATTAGQRKMETRLHEFRFSAIHGRKEQNLFVAKRTRTSVWRLRPIDFKPPSATRCSPNASPAIREV
jgi:hypothetical protein